MISICTPVHRIIPWWNLRLINICMQPFGDWEWIILDNSNDGCVKKYIEWFFIKGQGLNYPECRKKIKTYYEPFKNVDYINGRLGVLRNRLIELTTCKDDEFIFMLDSDDFIFNGFLNDIDDISKTYPDAEFITGMDNLELVQFMNSGEFSTSDNVYGYYYKYIDYYLADFCKHNGFDKYNGFAEMNEKYLNGEGFSYFIKDIPTMLAIPISDSSYWKMQLTKMLDIEDSLGFYKAYSHPNVFKKKAFLDKIHEYNTKTAAEDCIAYRFPHMFKTVYIKNPCYAQCMLVDSSGFRDSATTDLAEAKKDTNDKNRQEELNIHFFVERYMMSGKNDSERNCCNRIKPIFYHSKIR